MSSELAEFIRAHRERVLPAEVGLPDHGRRRTPGLRREELATLAGISIDYLSRLEQGRNTSPSASVLNALAFALRLTDDEKQHLVLLALRDSRPAGCAARHVPSDQLAPSVEVVLRRLAPAPAVVLSPYADLLGWNSAWAALVAPLGMIDGVRPNLARYVFGHPKARSTYPHWSAMADEQVRQLRAAVTRWDSDPRLGGLVTELSDDPEFAERWSRHGVAEKRRGTKSLTHPSAGDLTIAYEVMLLGDLLDQRLIVWLPADAHTGAVFDRLPDTATVTTPPVQLRLVEGDAAVG
jgi:transcriptional regulator with XRE-family HTH domain